MDKKKYVKLNQIQMGLVTVGSLLIWLMAKTAFVNFDFQATDGPSKYFSLNEKILIYGTLFVWLVIIAMEFRLFLKLDQRLRLYDSVFLISLVYFVYSGPNLWIKLIVLFGGLIAKCIWRIKSAEKILLTSPKKMPKKKKK